MGDRSSGTNPRAGEGWPRWSGTHGTIHTLAHGVEHEWSRGDSFVARGQPGGRKVSSSGERAQGWFLSTGGDPLGSRRGSTKTALSAGVGALCARGGICIKDRCVVPTPDADGLDSRCEDDPPWQVSKRSSSQRDDTSNENDGCQWPHGVGAEPTIKTQREARGGEMRGPWAADWATREQELTMLQHTWTCARASDAHRG